MARVVKTKFVSIVTEVTYRLNKNMIWQPCVRAPNMEKILIIYGEIGIWWNETGVDPTPIMAVYLK